MGQRSVRFPDELEALAVARARELDRPFSWVVVKALEAYVAPTVVAGPSVDPSVPIRHEDTRVGRAMSRVDGIPVESPGVGWCPKATCQMSGLLGERCPHHPNMRFKVRS